ncbi:MAG: hypothetical protein E6R03_17950 [Hyphomicrobiaceae bacterium]|nr:MAG: hypothetical protein E6R03_17950 [Hyphomicrobiaceae bacterium]
MSLIDFAETYNHSSLDRSPSLTDGRYLLMIDNIVTTTSKHAGDFVHVNFRVQKSEDMEYPDSSWLFGGKKPESGFPAAIKPEMAAHLSFNQKEEYQMANFFKLVGALEPSFVGTPEEQKANATISDATKTKRKKILKEIDSEAQPHRGRLLKATLGRTKAKGSGNPYRTMSFELEPLTAEQLKENRAELDG